MCIIETFEKKHGSTFSITEEWLDNWKICECCKMFCDCYEVISNDDIEFDLCPFCLYDINYGE